MSAKKTDALYYPALFCVFALFLFLVFYKLTLVIAAIDEVWISTDAVLLLNSNSNQYLTIPLFFIEHIKIPSMTCFYTGTLPNFLQIPFLCFLAPSYFSIRIGFIILAVPGLLSLNYCLRRWLGKWTALFVTLLTITDTMYLRAVRRGSEHEELLIFNLLWIGLAFFLLKIKTDKNRYLVGAGLIWGIALWSKLHMAVYIAGICLTCLIFNKQLKIRRIFSSLKDFTVFSIPFIIGCLPMINFYITEHDTLGKACGSFLMHFDPTPGLNIYTKPGIRLTQFIDFMKETHVEGWMPVQNIAFPAFAVMLIIFIAVYPFVRRRIAVQTKTTPFLAGVIITYALVFFSLFFAPNGADSSNILTMLPLFELVAGVFILAAANTKPRTRAVLALVFLTTLTHTSINRYLLMKTYYRNLEETGKSVQWTKAILDEAEEISGQSALYFTNNAYTHAVARLWYAKGPGKRKALLPTGKRTQNQDFYILTHSIEEYPGQLIFRKRYKVAGRQHGYALVKTREYCDVFDEAASMMAQ